MNRDEGSKDGPRVDGPWLIAADQAALEALVEAGFDAHRLTGLTGVRAERLAEVLGLLDPPGQAADTDGANTEGLVDATLARISMYETRRAESVGPRLSPNDDDALEALVGSGFSPEDVPSVLRPRARRQQSILDLLEPAPAETRMPGLIDLTLSRVQSQAEKQEDRLDLGRIRAGRRFRVADLMTVAALLLIAGAAIGPMIGAMRDQSRQLACLGGLQSAGLGFSAYATDSKDFLPMASASVAGNSWWVFGRPEQSNSANFFTLARTGYTKVRDLACAGNSDACREDLKPGAMDWRTLGEVSYSYQNMFGRPASLRQLSHLPGSTVIAADGSPVVRRAYFKRTINPLANSMNHGGRGQNILHADGSVLWVTSPVMPDGDNLWLPQVVEQMIAKMSSPTQADPIVGNETPAEAGDSFLVP